MRKFFIYLFLTVFLLNTSCAMFKREIEYSVKKDVKEYFDDNFNSYAESYHNERTKNFKGTFGWWLGLAATLIGITAGTINIINKRNESRKNKKQNAEYFDNMKGKNERQG